MKTETSGVLQDSRDPFVQAARSVLNRRTSSLKSTAPPAADRKQFLLDRITMGRTPFMSEQYDKLGYTGFLEWQLDYENVQEPAGLSAAIEKESAEAHFVWNATPQEIGKTYGPIGAPVQAFAPLAAMLNMQYSHRQLLWVMTDFFQNVHNTFVSQPLAFRWWGQFLRETVHPNALGDYATMVRESGQGPSMLWYLGQYNSTKEEPNENYAREVMELHTVGEDDVQIGKVTFPTYTEPEIAEAAKIFTGWGFQSSDPDSFGFHADKHAPGDKTIDFLGKTYPFADDESQGTQFTADLVSSPLAALWISRRLVQWFLGDDYEVQFLPVWLRTAVRFYLTGGDIKETVRELFDETYWDQLDQGPRLKVRRPLNLVVALKRLTGAQNTSPGASPWLIQQLAMGQVPGHWPAPNGYQPENEKWTSSVQPRVHFLYETFFGSNGLTISDASLADLFENVAMGNYSAHANELALGGCMTDGEVEAAQAHVDTFINEADARRWALFLALSSASYQYLC